MKERPVGVPAPWPLGTRPARAPRSEPATGPTSARHFLQLQRAVGNRAVERLVGLQRHPNGAYSDEVEEKGLLPVQPRGDPVMASAMLTGDESRLQREIWTFDGNQWTGSESGPGVPTPTPPQARKGDKFDDRQKRLFSSDNVVVRGQEGSSWGRTTYGDVPGNVEDVIRAGVVGAKVAVDTAAQRVREAVYLVAAGRAPAPLLQALALAFNVPEGTSAERHGQILRVVLGGLTGIERGLEQPDLPIIKAAAKVKRLWHEEDMTTAGGYVEFGLGEAFGDIPKRTDPKQFFGRSGEIHINWAKLGHPREVIKLIVHEASHKFIGTWDLTYGVDSSMGTGEWLRDQANRMATDESTVRSRMTWSAFADAVRLTVENGAEKMDDKKAAGALKLQAFNLKTELTKPGQTNAPDKVFEAAVDELAADERLPKSTRNTLLSFKSRETLLEHLAQHGSQMGVKGPAPLFFLPTDYLLNNADSYMDFVAAIT